jgi:hypothetical protein
MRDAVVVQEAPVRVEARSAVRLGYYRADQVDFRADLQSACAGLVAGEGELLRAVYSHPLIAGDPVDVENVLTYNVGEGCLRTATVNGLLLERAFAVTPDPRFNDRLDHVMTYGLTTLDAWLHWTAGQPLASITLPDITSLVNINARRLWVAARRAGVIAYESREEVPEAVVVDVEVQAPVGVRVGLLRVMKPLVDGLLAAAHSYSGVHLERLVRLATVMDPSLQPDEFRSWLIDPSAPLGLTPFVFPRGTGLQVSPADDRIVALRLVRRVGPASVKCSISTAASPKCSP